VKTVALGAALLLLSSAAYAQTSPQTNAGTTAQSQSSSDSNRLMRNLSGAGGQSEKTGATQRESSGVQTDGRARQESGTRVGVGIETRERSGVSVRTRTVREIDEPSVSVTRRRSVTTYEEPETEIHRTVVKKKPAKKVAVKKVKRTNKVVSKKRRYQVVEQPVEVRRRTVRRYEEVSEPSVSVRSRTTIHRTQDTSPRVGVSVEQRRSNDVNMSTNRTRSSSPDTTGSVSTRSTNDVKGSTSNSTRGNSTNMRLQQGGSSGSGSNGMSQ